MVRTHPATIIFMYRSVTATAYLNQHVFPVLLPGLDNMLRTAMTTEVSLNSRLQTKRLVD